ncbi:hypothetical protein ACIGZJ_36570 [Kitasatospora sp. NPDC052868]|uniref:hypothetical protein n=1 Tax=Kitasatospora sp. NPDC052868 TaxID=3364060 RepID=UPI0037C73614
MNRTTEYDPRTEVRTPAHQVHTPAHQPISTAARIVLGVMFVAMISVGIAGGIATYGNMKTALGSSTTALGVVAVGEGGTAVLGLGLVGLTLLSRPYPLGMRLGLWLIPIAGSVTGATAALMQKTPDYQHVMVNLATPLAMTVAAEMAGYLARSIVVASRGVDAEADRKTGETLRRIEWHQARAEHHPNERTRNRSAKAAWRLAKRLGRNDPRLGQQLPAAYAERTATTALTALDSLYHRVPAQQPAELPAAPAPVVPAAVEPPTTPTVEQPPAVEEEPEVVTGTYATDWIKNESWQPDPSIYAASYQEAEVVEDQAVEPAQLQLPADRWLQSVPTEVHTPVHTGSDQQVDEDDQEPETTGEMTAERRREIILEAIAAGKSQRETAKLAECSPSYVRKVVSGEAAA